MMICAHLQQELARSLFLADRGASVRRPARLPAPPGCDTILAYLPEPSRSSLPEPSAYPSLHVSGREEERAVRRQALCRRLSHSHHLSARHLSGLRCRAQDP